MEKRRFLQISLLLTLSFSLLADDTDIYFGGTTSDGEAPTPLVMLSLDWRPNLGAPQCDLDKNVTIEKVVGYVVDEFGKLVLDKKGNPEPITETVEVDECQAKLGDRLYQAIDVESGVVTLFDTFRAVLRVVFEPLENVSVGFMINHDSTCTGNQVDCSNGAYILRGFKRFELGDTNGAKAELLEKLAAIPLPQGVEAHFFQGKELYLELHRYLTGGKIVNAHKGYSDYASQNPGGTPDVNLDGSTLTTRPESAVNLNKRGEVINPLVAWDKSIEINSDTYSSPYDDGQDWSCSKTYMVNTMFQVSQQEDDSDTHLQDSFDKKFSRTGMAKTFPDIIRSMYWIDHAGTDHDGGLPNVQVGSSVAGNQNVTSVFIVDKANKTTAGYADAGGLGKDGLIEAGEPEQLLLEFENLFGSILSVSATFVASSVPVNVLNRAEALPDVYFAIFEADRKGRALWPGNLKKYTLVEKDSDGDGENDYLDIEDAEGKSAFDRVDSGRIAYKALSFWTDRTAFDVVHYEEDKDDLPGKDGRSVYRGGAGQRIPGFLDPSDDTVPGTPGLSNSDNNSGQVDYQPRQIFIEPPVVDNDSNSGNTLQPLRADYDLLDPIDLAELLVLKTEMGLPDAATAEDVVDMLKWARGLDVDDLDGDGILNEARTYLNDVELAGLPEQDEIPWLMGDILHSRPKAINYGCLDEKCESAEIRVFFGANDGFFRMIDDGPDGDGEETWAFMPRAMLKNLQRWRSLMPQGYKHPYGVDGEATFLVIDNNGDNLLTRTGQNDAHCKAGAENCDRVYAYFGLRRGGNAYYALDVSNPGQPPAQLWGIEKDTDDFAELGLSFSTPQLALVQFQKESDIGNVGYGDPDITDEPMPTPVVIFGGGYYGGWDDTFTNRVGKDDADYRASNANPDAEGNAIYIVHARTGELIWKATLGSSEGSQSETEYTHPGLIHSIPSEVVLWDEDRNGITDRLYVGDSGGNIWRVDLPEGSDSSHRSGAWFITKFAELGDDYRFFHKPDVAAVRENAGTRYDAVALGAGDRAHPLNVTDTNQFFMLKDFIVNQPSSSAQANAIKSRSPLTMDDMPNITDLCINGECSQDFSSGWYLTMEESGEKVLSAPLIVSGELFFTTYLPSAGVEDCEPKEGESRLYIVELADGSPSRSLQGGVEGSYSKLDRWVHGGLGMVGDPVWYRDYVGILGKQAEKTTFDERYQVFWRDATADKLD